MYRSTSKKGNFLKRVASDSTKPYATGKIPDIPKWAAKVDINSAEEQCRILESRNQRKNRPNINPKSRLSRAQLKLDIVLSDIYTKEIQIQQFLHKLSVTKDKEQKRRFRDSVISRIVNLNKLHIQKELLRQRLSKLNKQS